MLSLLWEINKSLATAIKPRYQVLFFWEEETQRSPSYLGFQLPIRVSLSPKTLPIALLFARIMCVLLYFSSLFIIPNSSNITFSTPNLSWYIWFWHVFIANKWKFSSYFFIDFFIGKAKSRCPITFHLLFITGGILHYQYLFPYHLYCFLQLFQITIVVHITCWQYSTTEQEFHIHQHYKYTPLLQNILWYLCWCF